MTCVINVTYNLYHYMLGYNNYFYSSTCRCENIVVQNE
jgi:hypothetical protein